LGKCPKCNQWNSFIEEVKPPESRRTFSFKVPKSTVTPLSKVKFPKIDYFPTGIKEFDRVLVNGLVPGSLILLGGEPGIGKSTLLLQVVCNLDPSFKSLFICGEESLSQVKMRAQRIGFAPSNVYLLSETEMTEINEQIEEINPKLIVIDSIQSTYFSQIPSLPGSITQVRECATNFLQWAKKRGICVIIIGHVTKEGVIAGPKLLEHMVDVVLYLEGERDRSFRILRSIKNRFGSTNQIGLFQMSSVGIEGVKNPSALFLEERAKGIPGSTILSTISGNRSLLLEVQSLFSPSKLVIPRRFCTGLSSKRVAMILAVLNRRLGFKTDSYDLYINLVGGMVINEPGADLPMAMAMISVLKNKPIDEKTASFGEVGLGGEIRFVNGSKKRIEEALSHGFKKIIYPHSCGKIDITTDAELVRLKNLKLLKI